MRVRMGKSSVFRTTAQELSDAINDRFIAFFLALSVAKVAVSVLLRYGKGYGSKHSMRERRPFAFSESDLSRR